MQRIFTKNRNRIIGGSRGASLIETAIALPIFLVFILSAIEILWFFHVKISLEYAAQQAVDLAAKLPLETPIDTGQTNNSCSVTTPCDDFKASYKKIVDAALRNTSLVARSPGQGGAVTLRGFTHFVQADYSQTIWGGMVGYSCQEPMTRPEGPCPIAIVRPGEAVRYADRPSDKWSYPFRSDDGGTVTPGKGWPDSSNNNENWSQLLAELPLAVHLEAYYTPLTPFFKSIVGPLKISITQYGFRNSGQKGIAAPFSSSSAATNSSSSNSSSSNSSSSSSSSLSPQCTALIQSCSQPGNKRYCCTHPGDSGCTLDCLSNQSTCAFGIQCNVT